MPHLVSRVGHLPVMTADRKRDPRSTERSEGDSEHVFGSTTWKWKQVRMARPPEAMSTAPRTGHRWRRLPRIDWRKPLHLTITYRGGAEAWVEIHARGDLGRYTGDTAIIDVLLDITRNR